MKSGTLSFAVLSASAAPCLCLCAPRSIPRAQVVRSEAPVIVTVDDLLSTDDVLDIRRQLLERDLVPTSDYQEDVFASGAEAEEEAHFQRAVEAARLDVPEPYRSDPLQSFVWAVTNAPGVVPEEDVIRGANAILRRRAVERWRSEEGRALLELSADDRPFERAGRRFRMPGLLRSFLERELVPRVLSADLGTVAWTVRDATVVAYREGESQVPHIDPCDATLLIYLSNGGGSDDDDENGNGGDDCKGGETAFPLADCRIEPRCGRGLLFFSSALPAVCYSEDSERRERETLSLHHGGRVVRGEKLVAQLMLDADLKRPTDSWIDLVSCLQ